MKRSKAVFALLALALLAIPIQIMPVNAAQSVYLAVYYPPSIAADGHSYPFIVQAYADSAFKSPIKVNGTLTVTTSSPSLVSLTSPVTMINGEAVDNVQANDAGAYLKVEHTVEVTASLPGAVPGEVNVTVFPPYDPYITHVSAPAYAPAGGYFPTVISGLAGGVPVGTNLSMYASTNATGTNLAYFQQHIGWLQGMTATSNNLTQITAAGDGFQAGINYTTVVGVTGSATVNNAVLHLATAGTLTQGIWPVVIYATTSTLVQTSVKQGNNTVLVNSTVTQLVPVGDLNTAYYDLSSSTPLIASVNYITSWFNNDYLIGYINVQRAGVFNLTVIGAGFDSATLQVTSVDSNNPFRIATFGPPSTLGEYQVGLEVLSYDNSPGLPEHVYVTPTIVTEATSTTTVNPFTFVDGFALLADNGPGTADLYIQTPGMYTREVLVTLPSYVTPPPPPGPAQYSVTFDSNAPVNFNVTTFSGVNLPYSIVQRTVGYNQTGMIEINANVTVPKSIAVGYTIYTFSKWQDNATALTRLVNSNQVLFANYTKVETAIELSSNVSFNLNGTVAGGKTVPITLGKVVISRVGVNVTLPFTVAGPNSSVQYQFTKWADGYASLTRTLEPGGNYSVVYATQYAVSGTSQYGSINGLGFHSAGSAVNVTLSHTTFSTSIPLVSAHVTGWIVNGKQVSGPAADFAISGPTTVKPVFATDYLMLIIAVAAAGGGGGGGFFMFRRWRKNRKSGSSSDESGGDEGLSSI